MKLTVTLSFSADAVALLANNPASFTASLAVTLGLDLATIKNVRVVASPVRRLDAEKDHLVVPRRKLLSDVYIAFDIITDLASAGFVTNDAFVTAIQSVRRR